MIKFLMRLFCRHRWKRTTKGRRNYMYGASSFSYDSYSVCKCTKCGKKKLLRQHHWIAMN